MKKLLLAFLAGIICCIIAMSILIVNVLLNRKDNSIPAPQDTTQHQTPTDNPVVEKSNQVDDTNINSTTITDNPEAYTNHIMTLNPNTQQDFAPTGELSAVHGRGGREHLRSVPRQFTQKDEYVHKEVYDPLMALIKHAQNDGVRLSIVSAYRSYEHQKRIWERKWGDADNANTNKALEVLRYSSFPGTSRHHWGTDIDFNSLSPNYWQSGEGAKIHRWLTKNAPNYGFCQTYGYNRSGGYAKEDWHWSHMPTANRYYAQINDPRVLAIATSQSIKGAAAIRNIDKHLYEYIQGISPCHVSNYQGGPVSFESTPKNANKSDNLSNHSTFEPITKTNQELAKSLPPKQPKTHTASPNPKTEINPLPSGLAGNHQETALPTEPPTQPNISNKDNAIKMSWSNPNTNPNP